MEPNNRSCENRHGRRWFAGIQKKILNIRGVAVFCLVVGTIWLGLKFTEDTWTFLERVENLANEDKEVVELAMRPLYFEYHSYELLQESAERLTSYATEISKGIEREDFSRVRIIGHSSVVAPSYNINRSEHRARTVVEKLVALGVDRNRIEFEGVGAEEPLPGHEADSPYNNRVEIELL